MKVTTDPKEKHCRVHRYAVVRITSNVMQAEDEDLALLAFDHAVNYDTLLRNKVGRHVVQEIEFVKLDDAEVEVVNLESLTGEFSEDHYYTEEEIASLKKKYKGLRKFKPASGSPGSPGGKSPRPKRG